MFCRLATQPRSLARSVAGQIGTGFPIWGVCAYARVYGDIGETRPYLSTDRCAAAAVAMVSAHRDERGHGLRSGLFQRLYRALDFDGLYPQARRAPHWRADAGGAEGREAKAGRGQEIKRRRRTFEIRESWHRQAPRRQGPQGRRYARSGIVAHPTPPRQPRRKAISKLCSRRRRSSWQLRSAFHRRPGA